MKKLNYSNESINPYLHFNLFKYKYLLLMQEQNTQTNLVSKDTTDRSQLEIEDIFLFPSK